MMRPAYLTLKLVLKYALWIYYPITRFINTPKKRFARTIYVSNHAASFMDPLVVASNQKPIVFFMTRSDVFTPIMKPILWAAHMLPIYRQQDGEDTKKKNEEVFQTCYRILKYGRSLLIFGEGFTDDVFIRRLKPIKKGAARIGFGALEKINWKKKIYIQVIGVNYEDPNVLGSGVVIANGNPICLNDYKKEYQKNANKVINDLTERIELELREQLTDVRDEKWATTHENVMRLTKKGMHAFDSDKSIPILERRNYSKKLAHWFNSQDLDQNPEMVQLKKDLQAYFTLLKRENIREDILTTHISKPLNKLQHYLKLVLLAPFVLIGLIHNYPAYRFVKRFTEKTFKRKVFWGSVKMTFGALLNGIYNIVLLVALNHLVYYNTLFWLIYFFSIVPVSGILAFYYFRNIDRYQQLQILKEKDLSSIVAKREQLIKEIHKAISVA